MFLIFPLPHIFCCRNKVKGLKRIIHNMIMMTSLQPLEFHGPFDTIYTKTVSAYYSEDLIV